MPQTTKKTTTTKSSAEKKPAAPRKPRAKTAAPKTSEKHVVHHVEHEKTEVKQVQPIAELSAELVKGGKYVYAVGRRKTSVANVRMFSGKEKHQVNKKDINAYFGLKGYVEEALKPLQLTGLETQVYVYANVKGGGAHSQAQAVAHALSNAIAKSNSDFRKVLKKNGLLTRDSRMKERKKPGLKRARRGPQWAKR